MKVLLIFALALLCHAGSLSAQSVKYGSNNGKTLTFFGTELYYEEYGKGMPLLLLHGGGGSISDFAKVIPALSKQFRVIAADSPGQGRSQQTDTLSYPLIARYMAALIDLLKLDSVYVMGWSDGGVTAWQLAIDRPDKVKRLITSGANLNYKGYNEGGRRLVDSMSPEYVGKEWGTWSRDYVAFRGADWQEFIRDLSKMWQQKVYITDQNYKTIKSRVMIVVGDRDFVTPEHAIEISRMLPGSALFIVPNTSHFVFHQSPTLITEAATAFFH